MAYTPEKVLAIARNEIGVHEIPDGSNDGPGVRGFQRVTGAYRAPWCMSFVQWAFSQVGAGPFANRTAGVFYAVNYARKHGWVLGKPEPGCVVAFMRGQGHTGIVETTFAGGFGTIEGNASNKVRRHSYASAGPYVFYRVPGEVKRKRVLLVPRFQIVTSENGHARVVVPWGKWSIVGPKVPQALASHRAAVVRRKVVKTRR